MLFAHPHRPRAWIADPDQPRSSSRPLQPVDVAVGILMRADQAFLMTTRPVGKVYAGHWEFPGGKLEPGESLVQALCRELDEELGIHVQDAQPWITVEVDYPHAQVQLLTCRIHQWRGELIMREGQEQAWCHWPLSLNPILPGAWPMLHSLAQVQGWSGPLMLDQPHNSTSNETSS